MFQCLLAGDALCGIKIEQLSENLKGHRVCTRKQSGKCDLRLDRERANVVLRLYQCDVNGDAGMNSYLKRTRGDPTRRRVSSDGVPR